MIDTQKNNIYNYSVWEIIKKGDIQSIVKFLVNGSQTILEIGCGIGDYIKNTKPTQTVFAVEPHKPYINEAKKKAPWVTYFNTDAISFFKYNTKNFDLILMIDVVEHLNEEEAVTLLNLAQNCCTNLIFSQIPYGLHQQDHDEWNLGGEYWQTHRSTWDEKNLSRLNFSTLEKLENFYTNNIEKNKTDSTVLGFWIKDFIENGFEELNNKYIEYFEKKNFLAWQEAYEKGYSSSMGNHRNYFYDAHLQNIGLYEAIDESNNVIEFAPGDASFIKQFIEFFPNKEFSLVDISEENLKKVQNIIGKFPNVITYLNFPEIKSFQNIDLVFSFLLCQSMPRSLWISHLETVFNMLKKDGSYFFQFAFKNNESSNDSIESAISGSNKYSVNEIAEMLEKVGFSGCDITVPITLETFESDIVWYICKAIK